MALPSGYTQLEYIKSSGTQYLNPNIVISPSSFGGLKIECDLQFVDTSVNNGVGTNAVWQNYLYFGLYLGGIYIGNGSTDVNTGVAYDGQRHVWTIDIPNALFSVDELVNMQGVTYSTPSITSNFLVPNWGDGIVFWGAKVWQNSVLQKDLLPCTNPNGEIGAYDLVNAVFYGNAGTDAFEAGPIVPPDEGIVSLQDAQLLISSDDATISLEFVVTDPATSETVDIDVESVFGTVNGSATAWTLSGTTWTATVPLSGLGQYLCVFDVATSDGKTVEMRLPLYYGVLSLVTDRTQADVDELLSILQTPFVDWTTEQAQLFYSGVSKGAYNASDFNRVGAAMVYIAERMASMGYAVADIAPKLYWMDTDTVTQSDMSAYLSDLAALRAVLELPGETPTVPADMAELTFTEANDIEQILTIINTMLTNITLAYMYAGELYGGEV